MTLQRAWSAVAALAVAATVAACGSQPARGARRSAAAPSALPPSVMPSAVPSSPGASSPAPSGGTVVHLSAGFSPSTVRLRTGQHFLLIVSKDVQATGLVKRGPCPPGTVSPVTGGLLTAQCMTGGRYLYTAKRAGTATVSATVKPRCPPGTVCPQWVTEPSLKVIIS